MPDWALFVVGGVTAAILGYLINQLPPIRDFPGRNVQVVFLTVWVVAFGIVLTALENNQQAERKQWLLLGCVVFATLAVSDAIRLGWSCWRQQQPLDASSSPRRQEPSTISAAQPVKKSRLNGWLALHSTFTHQYLKQQKKSCSEHTTSGFDPGTYIPLLEEVFVPLDLQGALYGTALAAAANPRELARWQQDVSLQSENLDIWRLLRRTKHDRQFRQMCILAKGGLGKTTLMRHIALIYGQGKQGRYRAPKLVPFLLRLRDWRDKLSQEHPPNLPTLITQYHVQSLSSNHALTPPANWAETLLINGKALVLFDGFDEVPARKRKQVSRWLSAQMAEYPESVFILTSRPAGYRDYVAKKPAVPIFINKFTPKQQEDFIRRWYFCQERMARDAKRKKRAREVADQRATSLIKQLDERRDDIGYMAENPLLLNMLVTFHRYDPAKDLPRQRLGLYRSIVKLQLDDRPRARGIIMLLPFKKSVAILQQLALGMMLMEQAGVAGVGKQSEQSASITLTFSHHSILSFLGQHSLLHQEEVSFEEWLKQMLDVSELLVEREPGEYEFPHASFQGYFAASELVRHEDNVSNQRSQQHVLDNWNEVIWHETVLLYVAQLPIRQLEPVIRVATQKGSEAAQLAKLCLAEYPRPDKLSDELKQLLNSLENIAQNAKYQTLETLLRNGKWRKADDETYRLMITTVGNEYSQLFDPEDLRDFPCEDLRTIDQLWVKYSNGKFGFSVQKKIYVECGAKLDGEYPGDKIWYEFCNRVGWREKGDYVVYSGLKFTLTSSSVGELPVLFTGWKGEGISGTLQLYMDSGMIGRWGISLFARDDL